MSKKPLAHSARPKQAILAQPYAEHVQNVVLLAEENARGAAEHVTASADRLIHAIRLAAEFHDLGKLDEANQRVLDADGGRKRCL